MKFFAIAALFAGAFAMPANVEQRTDRDVCPDGLFSNPLCCATDVLGAACLDAEVPSETPRDARNFEEICARKGQQARCCIIPLLGQGLVCNDVVGTD